MRYTPEETKAFWLKDLLMAKESAVKAISVLHEGKELSTEKLLEEADKIIKWFYPDGTDFKEPEIKSDGETFVKKSVPF